MRMCTPCASRFTSTGGSGNVGLKAPPSERQLEPVTAASERHVTHKNGSWSNESLKNAMNVVTNNGMPLREATRVFEVPTTSMTNHLYGKTRGSHRGIKSTLKSHEEKKIS